MIQLRALVATTGLEKFTCFHRKIHTNPDRWPTGDVIAFYAHARGVSMHEAAEAIVAQFAF